MRKLKELTKEEELEILKKRNSGEMRKNIIKEILKINESTKSEVAVH